MKWFDHLARDVRHALRTTSRMRLLAAVVIVSLGIGIGANVVVFSWLQAILLQPLPGVSHARSLVFVEPRSEAGTYPGVSWQEYEDLRDRLRTFDSLIAFRMVPFNVGEPSRNERIYGQLVSGNYFGALGLNPSAGRFFRPDEVSRSSGHFVAVVSHGLALTRFGSPAAAVGERLRVNDREVAIVGVAPEHFQGTVLSLDFSMWLPATLAPSLLPGSRELDSREVRGYAALGRLRPGTTRAQAQADLDGAMRELARVYPASNGSMAGQVLSFWAAPRGPQGMITGAVAALQGLMLLVLLAVCGNSANLMLARASTRQREIGVRVALGAGRARILSVLLAENVLLAAGGGLFGAALAAWGTNALRAIPFIGSFPIRFQTQVDALGLTVAMMLAVACGVLVGLAPALQLAGIEPQRALRNGSRTVSRSRLRSILMASEVALALIVLLVAGLFYRGLTATKEIDTGFKRAGVLLGAYDLTGRDASNRASREFAGRLLARLSAVPGIEAAAIATSVPLDIHGLPLRSFRIEGHARADGQPERALSNTVSRGYFATMGIPLIEGTDFADFAAPADRPQVIVNDEFVRRFFPGGTALGRQIQNGDRTYQICGVARTTLYESFDEDPTPIVYFSFRDRAASAGEIHVRTREGAEMAIATDLRRAVRDVDAALPVYDVRTMSEHVEKNLFLRRVPARMFALLGPVLLVLAAIGIYAVVAYGVAQRTTEIGVRLALGATGARVVAEVVADTLRIVAGGAIAGWLAVYLVQIHIAPGRPLPLSVFAGVPMVLLSVALAASWLPALRAASVDPMVALRHE